MAKRKLTEEEKKQFNERKRRTCLERHGSETYNNMAKNRATKLSRYGDENYNNQAKHEQTCLNRYDVKHHNQVREIAEKISKTKKLPETQAKYEATMIERHGNKNPNLVPEIREKYTSTLMRNHGVTNPLKSREIWLKRLNTMKRNGSFYTSRAEELVYDRLVSKYGKDDVFREYRDEYRYPFNCDFYVKSIDLFVEVNCHPSHGPHPFNINDEEDVNMLRELEQQNTSWSNMIIDVWTIRDVNKLLVAKNNNLNYETIYVVN